MRNFTIALCFFLVSGCGMTPNKAAIISAEAIGGLNREVMIAYESGYISATEARDAILSLKGALDRVRAIEATLDICDAGEADGLNCDVSGDREAVDRILADIQRKLQESEQ